MHFASFILTVVGFILLVGMPAGGQAGIFLAADAVDAVRLLPEPPTTGSDEDKAELQLMRWMQQQRTPEEIARAESESKVGVEAFRSVLGAWFTAGNLPRMEQMFQKLDKEAKHFGSLAKARFHRDRPPLEDARVQPLFDRRDDRSYPSDHATRGMILAIVLGELEPTKREALLERGRQIGWDRVIAGVHHPSDIMAGRVLGKAIALALLADKGFQEELAKVKEEYVRVKDR